MSLRVTLLDSTTNPLKTLYIAYRTAYSSLAPSRIEKRIVEERVTEEQMLLFIGERLETGHVSPLEKFVLEFSIEGASRAFSHQFVRHRVGLSLEQQSQRYVVFKQAFPFVTPQSVTKAGKEDRYLEVMEQLDEFYHELVEADVPSEDARFVLPNATCTNIDVTINFAALLHMADLRLCTRAQWEFRKVVAMMRSEVVKRWPLFGKQLQPKCGEHRLGYCDESYGDWEACPLGRKRPHKSVLFDAWNNQSLDVHEKAKPLGESDFQIIEGIS